MAGGNKNVEEGRLCAFLSYLVVGIIWYFADKDMKRNSFVKYHVKQGLVLLITSVILSIVGSMFSGILVLGNIINSVCGLCIFIFLVFGIVNSLNGKEKELPIIGLFAKKFTF